MNHSVSCGDFVCRVALDRSAIVAADGSFTHVLARFASTSRSNRTSAISAVRIYLAPASKSRTTLTTFPLSCTSVRSRPVVKPPRGSTRASTAWVTVNVSFWPTRLISTTTVYASGTRGMDEGGGDSDPGPDPPRSASSAFCSELPRDTPGQLIAGANM